MLLSVDVAVGSNARCTVSDDDRSTLFSFLARGATVPQALKTVSQDAQRTRWCLSLLSLLRSRSGDINQSPWSKVRRPGRASQVKRSDRVTLMPFFFLADMLVAMQHQEPVIQKVTAGALQVRGRGQGGGESLSAETSSHQRATTIQMILKTVDVPGVTRQSQLKP